MIGRHMAGQLMRNSAVTIHFAARLPVVPAAVVNAITAYGDARADGDIDLIRKRLAACIRAVRELMGSHEIPARMSTDRPAAPGWYWYALPGEWALQPVLVSLCDGELFYCREAIMDGGPEDGYPMSECNEEALWSATPIAEPSGAAKGAGA